MPQRFRISPFRLRLRPPIAEKRYNRPWRISGKPVFSYSTNAASSMVHHFLCHGYSSHLQNSPNTALPKDHILPFCSSTLINHCTKSIDFALILPIFYTPYGTHVYQKDRIYPWFPGTGFFLLTVVSLYYYIYHHAAALNWIELGKEARNRSIVVYASQTIMPRHDTPSLNGREFNTFHHHKDLLIQQLLVRSTFYLSSGCKYSRDCYMTEPYIMVYCHSCSCSTPLCQRRIRQFHNCLELVYIKWLQIHQFRMLDLSLTRNQLLYISNQTHDGTEMHTSHQSGSDFYFDPLKEMCKRNYFIENVGTYV